MSIYKASAARRAFVVANSILLVMLALTMVVPLVNVFAVSFMTDLESMEVGIKLFPREPSLSGYETLFKQVNILTPLRNNIIVTAVGTTLHVLLCAMAGYVLVKNRFLGKTLLVILVTLPMMIPFQMIIIPVFVMMRRLGLLDTLGSLIIIDIATTFSILLMKNFFEGIPKSLEESALMDGASEFTIFSRIYMPLALPGLATITIFDSVFRWNQFLPAVLFINSPENYTLQIALRSLVVSQELSSTTQQVANNTRMAGIVVAIIPLILVYVFGQNYFIKGITIGAVKE